MKLRTLLIALALMLLVALMATPISDVRAQDETPPEPTPEIGRASCRERV